MELTDEQQIDATDGDMGEAYVVKRVSPWLKLLKIVGALCAPLLFALALPDSDTAKVWLPPLAFVAAVWYGRKVYSVSEIRVLKTTKVRILAKNLKSKLWYATTALAVVCLAIAYAQRSETDDWVRYLRFGVAVGVYLCYLVVLLTPQYSETYSLAAKVEYARLEQEKAAAEDLKWSRINAVFAGIWSLWYVRYALGILLFWATVEMWPSPAKYAGATSVLLALFGLFCVKELTKWVIGAALVGGLAYAAIGAIAAIPVSAAIIIGALIIASSRSK
jgi:hypothetical protein